MKKILTLFTALILFGSMTVKADDVYIVAGNNSTIFGAEWIGDKTENKMEWEAARSLFVKTFTVAEAINGVELKVVKNNSDWMGDPLGNNVKFDLNGAGSFRVLFNTETGVASVEGAIVVPKSMYSVYAVGNGSGTWLNGESWNTNYADNKLTEVEPNVWEIAFSNVTAANGRELKFAVNGSWDVNFGGTFSAFDAVTETASNGSNITFNSPGGTSISARLDLRNCKSSDKSGGKFTVSSGSLPELHSCYVAGSSAEIFGTAWTSGLDANKMTLAGTTYSKTFTVTKAYKSVSLKAVYDGAWFGDNGENVKFSLSGAGTFTVTFDNFTHEVAVTGSIVGPEQFDFEYVTVAGNGTVGNPWVSEEDWNTSATANRMTEVSTDVYEIAFDYVSGAACEFKFSFNGGWDYQMSGVFSSFGEATTAVYNKEEAISFTPAAGAKITIRLDLSSFNFAEKTGATFTVIQELKAFVAGSEAEIFGTAWTTGLSVNEMTWHEDITKYAKVYTVDKAYKSVGLKVVYGAWYGVNGGEENVKFSLSGPGDFVVYFSKATHDVTVGGGIVGDEQFDFEYAAVAANGEGNWAHGEDWNAETTSNRMTEVATNVWEISFENVPAKYCQFKFCFDGAWTHEFGGTFSAFGAESSAIYGNSASSISFNATAGSTITIRLDMSGFNFATKEGATFTVSQVAPVVTVAAQGGWDNWEASLNFIPDGSGLTATATKHFDAGNYDFKLIVDGNWLSNANAFHRFWTSASGITSNNDENMQLQADADGDYIFTWTYATNAIAITFPETPKTGTNEVKFFPPRTEEHPWNEVYVYAWRRTGGENEQLTGDWPGIPATKDGEWYKATVEKGACVIFHDNAGMQSFDIENVQKDVCYVANEIVDGDPIKAKFYESCTVNYFLTSGDEAIMGAGNAWKADLAERQLDGSNEITLTALPAGIYEFKLTNGSWAWSLGGQEHLNSACSSAAVTSGNGNVKFKIESAQDVTISYNPATQKICLSAETVLPFEDVRAGLTADNYYTVCFNREMKQIRGASLWSFIGRDADFAYIVQESAPFEAGKPFIVYAESEKLEAILDGTAVEAEAIVANGALHGTFEKMYQADLNAAGDNIYLVIGNELRRVDGQTGNTLPAYRAYVDLDEIDLISTPSPAPGKKVRSMPMQKDQAQGIENIQTSDKPVKVVIEGTMYILRGENVYDATGRMIK